jgi:adenylate kinase family enzyme
VLPGDAVVPILRDHIAGLPSAGGEKVVLLDGFPRNVEQEEAARTVLASERGKGKFPDLAVYFSCPKDVLKERFVSHKRGQDDGALFEKRFEQHEKEFPDVMGIYKSRSVLVEVSEQRRYIGEGSDSRLTLMADRQHRGYRRDLRGVCRCPENFLAE